jgi:hypothetical protein
MDWMIWKIADPHTTNMNKARIMGPTGELSLCCFDDLGTFPLRMTFLLAFSFANRILCLGAISSSQINTEK